MPTVSIIIPNLNSPILGNTIESLLNQDFSGNFEIIVVGQDKYNFEKRFPQASFVHTHQPANPAKARNIGISKSNGETLVFIDADCIAEKNWLKILLSSMSENNVKVVGGGVDFSSKNFWVLCDNISSFHDYLVTTPKGFRNQLPSLNLGMVKEMIKKYGGFNENYPIGEDSELTTRLSTRGMKLYFEPQAIVNHHPQRGSLLAIIKHAYNYGRFSIKVNSDYQAILGIPFILRNWLSTIICSPFLSIYVIGKMIGSNKLPIKYWYTLPVVFFLKIVWCFGASRTLFEKNKPVD